MSSYNMFQEPSEYQAYEEGYKQGRQDAIRKIKVIKDGGEYDVYFDDSRQLIFTSYITMEAAKMMGIDIKEQKK